MGEHLFQVLLVVGPVAPERGLTNVAAPLVLRHAALEEVAEQHGAEPLAAVVLAAQFVVVRQRRLLLVGRFDHVEDFHPRLVPVRPGLGDVEETARLLVEGGQVRLGVETAQAEIHALSVRPCGHLFLAVPAAMVRVP
ncbi:hypothetical protein [Nonomuraea guangzhouensis]|uniref:Secreted protein n=1 Tax=Nonomuraea guangzhouensis TaxID=1291555 RepID=A0ABW4H0D3_9ACTN|nr:hypothetical protein [Nonomuraea guangzhouensis]